MEKDFEGWSALKQKLDAIKHPPLFNEREIWWCSIGMNIGYEVYGKGRLFTRPVLVVRKQSINTFIGIPMSTRVKQRADYYPLVFKERQVTLLLGEIRKFDSRRLADKMGKIGEEKFDAIKAEIIKSFQPC